MKNNNHTEYLSPPKSTSKPYERKICINKIIPKSYFTENNIDNIEENGPKNLFSPDNNFQIKTQNDNRYNEEQNSKQYNFTEEFKKNQTDNSDNIQNNFEYISLDKNSKQSYNRTEQDLNKKILLENNNNQFIKKNYQTKYIEGENNTETNEQNQKYKYKYKYKKFQKDEKNIEYDNKKKEEEEQNEEEAEDESKEDKEKIDLQELKKKPGKILHKSVKETYDEDGNRIVTTKTIQEYRQNTPGFRIKDIHQMKEKKEYERHTTNIINNNNKNIKERKTNLSYKNRINNNKEIKYIFWLN